MRDIDGNTADNAHVDGITADNTRGTCGDEADGDRGAGDADVAGDCGADSRGADEALRDRGDTAGNTADHAEAIWDNIANENYTSDGDIAAADMRGDTDNRDGDTDK